MKKLYEETDVQAIADAIREKTGKTDKMKIAEMSGEIEGINRYSSKAIADAIEQRFISIGWTKAENVPDNFTKYNAWEYASKKQYIRVETIPNDNSFEKVGNVIAEKLRDDKTTIPQYTYCETSNLALTSLPEGLTSIDTSAFYNCSNLTLTSLPEGLTSIGGSAFNNCPNLALTSLPEGLTSIGGSAFNNCTNLALTSLPEGLTSIDTSAFYNCSNLALTSLPEGLTSIGTSAFYRCFNITHMRCPATLISIGAAAFSSAPLKALILPGGTLVSLANTNAINGINSVNGYIYVPKSLIDDYKVATNWATFADRFRALEDYTVDGTTTGELDESKI